MTLVLVVDRDPAIRSLMAKSLAEKGYAVRTAEDGAEALDPVDRAIPSAVLLDLVRSGLSREDAYALTQAAAMQTWEGGAPFRETLRARATAAGVTLDEAGLDEAMRPERYVERLGPVFDRLAALS